MPKGHDAVPLLDSYTAQLFGAMQTVTIQQKVDLMEAVLTNTIGCGEQPNKYKVFDTQTGYPLFHVEEFNNNACLRCCCAPNHSLFAKYFVLNPDGSINTGMPPVLTMEREGICGPNCKQPCCFACTTGCRDEMRLHAGDITVGDPGACASDRVIGGALQPFLGGGFTPTVQVMDREKEGLNKENPISIVEGPFCCIGGCLQMCMDMSFSFSNVPAGYNGEVLKLGDLATIEKKKPDSFSSAVREAMTDADTYTVTFVDPGLTPQQKASILTTVIFLDYMFFENDNDMIYCDPFNKSVTITPFVCYCCGCLCPCSVTCGGEEKHSHS